MDEDVWSRLASRETVRLEGLVKAFTRGCEILEMVHAFGSMYMYAYMFILLGRTGSGFCGTHELFYMMVRWARW